MKKRFLLTIGLIVLSMQAAIAQKAIATLHHKDSVFVYSNDQVQTAIDKAVDGDIIYLSEGLFSAFTVGKNITIMGAGKGTVIPGKTVITNCKGLKLSNMHFSVSLYFNNKENVSDTRLSQCLINNLVFSGSDGKGYFSNIEITMSQITEALTLDSYIRGLTVTNSKITNIEGYGSSKSAVKFINCNIANVKQKDNIRHNAYQNCIIGTITYGTYTNCLLKDSDSGTDCYKDTDFTFDNDMNCSLNESELRKKGYLGSDGSVVGVDGGGGTPFTLASPLLQVVEHEIEVDNKNKRLRVTLNLGNK